ncbi:unnamed protein product [Caenorhabditis brenneri]
MNIVELCGLTIRQSAQIINTNERLIAVLKERLDLMQDAININNNIIESNKSLIGEMDSVIKLRGTIIDKTKNIITVSRSVLSKKRKQKELIAEIDAKRAALRCAIQENSEQQAQKDDQKNLTNDPEA